MQMKKFFMIFGAMVLGVFLSMPVWAANVNIDVLGALGSAQQGETKPFIIKVSAVGALNIDQHPNPGTVTVNTAYTAGGGSGSPNSNSTFKAPATIIEGCQPKDGVCKNTQNVSGGPYEIGASVTIPENLPTGEYVITIAAWATNGFTLPNVMPSFVLKVEAAGSAPSVTILSPLDNSPYKVNQPVMASVEVNSEFPVKVDGYLNGELVELALNTESGHWEAPLQLSTPGMNTFSVTAENAVGSTMAVVQFSVHYDFAGWMPPITTAKFQNGRTLPVKFQVNDYYGPTNTAVAEIYLNKTPQGMAQVFYDSYGFPYYQLNVDLNVGTGSQVIKVVLDDGYTHEKSIQVK